MPIQQTFSVEDALLDPDPRPFTDRAEHIHAFVDAIERQDPDEPRVLVYHGIGGIGKTRLVDELGQMLDGESEKAQELGLFTNSDQCSHFRWAKIDFEESRRRRPPQGLYHLRTRLLKKYGFQFPTFDLAFAEYWSKAYPEASLTEPKFPMLEEHGDFLLACADLVEDIPGVGVLTKIPKRLGHLSRKAREWYHKRNEEALQDVPALSAHEIEKRLPGFWTHDFNNELDQSRGQGVLFVDSFETLQEDQSGKYRRQRADAWIREWIAGLTGTLVVLAGRKRLYWPEEVDEDWESLLQQHHVDDLSSAHARSFLVGSGIKDEDIQDRIIETTSGIPYDLDLAVSLHEEIISRGEEPKPENFGKTPEELSDCFFKFLGEEEGAMLELLAIPRTFGPDIAKALVDEFDPGFPVGQFPKLRRFPFVSRIDRGGKQRQNTYILHERAREALQEHARFVDKPEVVHEFLFEYHTETIEVLEPHMIESHHEQALEAAFYHGLRFMDIEAFSSWFFEAVEVFDRAARLQVIEPMYERVLELQEAALGENSSDVALTLTCLATVYRRQERIMEAQSLLNRAHKIFGSMNCEDHSGAATTLNSLGVLYIRQGRLEEAKTLLEQALDLYKSAPGDHHHSIAGTLCNLGLVHQFQGQSEDAESSYRRVLEVAKTVSDQAAAKALNNLAELYREQNLHEEAEPLYLQALEINEKVLGKDHPEVATLLGNLGSLYEKQGRHEDAESFYRRALEISETVMGENHLAVADHLSNLAELCKKRDRYEEAESFYKRELKTLESAYGEDHLDVGATLLNLASLYEGQGRYEDAESFYRRALEILEAVLGKSHPRVAELLELLAGVYLMQDQFEEAESLYHRVLKIYEAALDEDHPYLPRSLHNLGALYQRQGRPEEAETLYERALNILRRTLGPEDPRTKHVELHLASVRDSETG